MVISLINIPSNKGVPKVGRGLPRRNLTPDHVHLSHLRFSVEEAILIILM